MQDSLDNRHLRIVATRPILYAHIAQVCSVWSIEHLVDSKLRQGLMQVLEQASSIAK
jgi:hypothetical protein